MGFFKKFKGIVKKAAVAYADAYTGGAASAYLASRKKQGEPGEPMEPAPPGFEGGGGKMRVPTWAKTFSSGHPGPLAMSSRQRTGRARAFASRAKALLVKHPRVLRTIDRVRQARLATPTRPATAPPGGFARVVNQLPVNPILSGRFNATHAHKLSAITRTRGRHGVQSRNRRWA